MRPAEASARSASAKRRFDVARGAARAGAVLDDERRDAVSEAERFEPAPQVGTLDLPADDRRKDIAREPAFGVMRDPFAQQLERDDRRRLTQRQPIEVRQGARRP